MGAARLEGLWITKTGFTPFPSSVSRFSGNQLHGILHGHAVSCNYDTATLMLLRGLQKVEKEHDKFTNCMDAALAFAE